jgi:polyhydroxyalkanoate synthase
VKTARVTDALASAARGIASWPVAQLEQLHAGLLEEQHRAWRRLLRWPRLITAALDAPTGATPYEVVLQMGTLSLRRYRSARPSPDAPPLLFCYALVNRPYILDLQADKSVVRRYLDAGFDVYLIDWGVPSHADRHLTLEHYVERLLGTVVDFVLGQQRAQRLHLLGYCMGGTLAALYTALHPEQIATLTLLAAPIDFGGRESLLNLWTDARCFDVDAFIDAYGNCPAPFLQACFLNTKPVQNLLTKNLALYDQMEDQRFLANYFALERWVNDNIPVAGETFREFVKKLYQENQLVRGEFELAGRRVDLAQITCPLLLLTAQSDHLVPPSSTLGLRAHVGSLDVEEQTIEAGHVGLVVGGKAHATFWPAAVRWLAARAATSAGIPRTSENGNPRGMESHGH